MPFQEDAFDLVYTWGVLHHTPETMAAFREAFRVLKPRGRLKAMVYHIPSWTAFALYMKYSFLRLKPHVGLRQVVFDHLESPETKAYTMREARMLLAQAEFAQVSLSTCLSPGDLPTIKPSSRYQSKLNNVLWKLYPRWFVRLCGQRFGLCLLIDACKPSATA
ncbi:class I SAM-dependent methyltransferase [Acidobacteria bacterium AH-259-A15]|nr:class I SAM-dependent methyltransferase [Acidobacteria bacterium AH-259-A15]